jgi:PAS domain-containing protein
MASVRRSIHVLRFVNHAFCRVLDKDQEELIGKPFAETVPVKHPLQSSLEQVFRTGQPESHAVLSGHQKRIGLRARKGK